MLGVGGLMGIAVATSCLLGAFVNFVVLAPLMIRPATSCSGSTPTARQCDLARRDRQPVSLWWGVTMMVVGSLVSLLGRPEIFKGLFKRSDRAQGADVLAHIESRCGFRGRHPARQRARAPGSRTSSSACRGCWRSSRCR